MDDFDFVVEDFSPVRQKLTETVLSWALTFRVYLLFSGLVKYTYIHTCKHAIHKHVSV